MKSVFVSSRVIGLKKTIDKLNKNQSTGPAPVLYPQKNEVKK
ncbi:MAG: hypothetical protein PQJ59_17000 [Spirochaetales bacterium]|nr:hypothetical protein [Spirochaetales bacterium]